MVRSERPVDLKHLDNATGGDRALGEEVLQLFETHCRDIVEKLEGHASDTKIWREAAHTLKGAARGIGAFDLADAAAEAEKAQGDADKTLAALTRIKEQSAAVQVFIEEFLKRNN